MRNSCIRKKVNPLKPLKQHCKLKNILNPKKTQQTRVKTYVTTTNKHAIGLEIARNKMM
jgi:hypothetical protein